MRIRKMDILTRVRSNLIRNSDLTVQVIPPFPLLVRVSVRNPLSRNMTQRDFESLLPEETQVQLGIFCKPDLEIDLLHSLIGLGKNGFSLNVDANRIVLTTQLFLQDLLLFPSDSLAKGAILLADIYQQLKVPELATRAQRVAEHRSLKRIPLAFILLVIMLTGVIIVDSLKQFDIPLAITLMGAWGILLTPILYARFLTM